MSLYPLTSRVRRAVRFVACKVRHVPGRRVLIATVAAGTVQTEHGDVSVPASRLYVTTCRRCFKAMVETEAGDQ